MIGTRLGWPGPRDPSCASTTLHSSFALPPHHPPLALSPQVRFQYDKSAAFITQLLDPLVAAFKQVRGPGGGRQRCQSGAVSIMRRSAPLLVYFVSLACKSVRPTSRKRGRTAVQASVAVMPAPQLAALEGQVTWLVYMIGSIIKGRLSSSAAESQVRALCAQASLVRAPWCGASSLHAAARMPDGIACSSLQPAWPVAGNH